MTYTDYCPTCESTDLEYLGDYNVRCDAGHEFNLRVVRGLSMTHCEACGNRLSWGCGHDPMDESEAVAHRSTVEHESGACWHYDHGACSPEHCHLAGTSVKGYAPFVKHFEQAIRYGAADPRTGEAFTSAQRQAWIDTGKVPDVADTFPA